MRILTRFVVVALFAAFAVTPILAVGPPSPTRPSEADMVGTWAGTVTVNQTSDVFDGGVIVISRDAGRLVASVGPNERVRFRSQRLTQTERGLRFEVTMPDRDATRLLVYDLTFANGSMTGTVTFVRHGLTSPGQLAFARQWPASRVADAR